MWDKYIFVSIFILLASLILGSLYFTFIFTPSIFHSYDVKTASEIVNGYFKYYFKIWWISGIVIYTLIGILSFKNKEIIKDFKWFLIFLFVLVIINIAQDRAILSLAQSINQEYFSYLSEKDFTNANILKNKFKTLHSISSILNLISIAIGLILLYTLLKFKNKFAIINIRNKEVN